MKFQFNVALLVAAAAYALPGFAAVDPNAGSPVQVGSPVFGGAACPSDTTVAKVIPAEDDVSVVGELKPTTAKAGGKSGKSLAQQACNVTIPIEVAKGFQAALTGAKFEGSYDLPSGARATMRTERFVAGGSGLKREQNLVGTPTGLSGSYESEMAPEEAVWTSCAGGGYNLRSQTRLVLQNDGKARVASLSIGRSGETKTHMVYKVQWRRCR